MAHRVVHSHFEKFAQARLAFVRAMADCAERPEYVEFLLSEDVFASLRPLLHDKVPTVTATAALAVGRIASFSPELAFEVVKAGLLDDVNATVPGSHPSHMKAAAFVFRSISKHTPDLAQCCIDAGCVGTMVGCLEHGDVTVREAAASALSLLASHTPAQATAVAATGCLPMLVAALQDVEPALKRAAAGALGEIANAAPALATAVAEAGAFPMLIQSLRHSEVKVRRQAGQTLVAIVKHGSDLASIAVASNILPTSLLMLQDTDGAVRKHAACLIREVVKQDEACAAAAAAGGALPSLVEYMALRATGADRLPATIAVGYIASYSPALASQAIDSGCVSALKDVMLEDGEDHLIAAAVWSMGQMGKHGVEHTRAVAEADVMRHIMAHHIAPASSEDLVEKSKRALTAMLQHCDHLMALQSLIPAAPSNLMAMVLRCIATIVSNDLEERRSFVASGGLKAVQAVDLSSMDVAAALADVNSAYPPEVVEYVKPSFLATLADRMG